MQSMRTVAIAVVRALALITFASGFVTAPAAAELPNEAAPLPGPQELMSDLSARLFAVLDKESARARHNSDKILPLVDGLLSPHFDTEYAARMVLGLHWRSATLEQRQQFGVVLYQRLLRTYAGAVAEWTPDRFKLLPLRADPEALQVTVHTLVTNSHHEIVAVDFRMRQTAKGWKIFDVTRRIVADERRSDVLIDIRHSLAYVFAPVAARISIAQFDRLVLPRGCTGGYRGMARESIGTCDLDADSWHTARIEHFSSSYRFD